MKPNKPTFMWVMISKSGYVDYRSMSYLRKDCIANFVKDSGNTWRGWQKFWKGKDHGYSVKRVIVTIETID